MLLGTEVGLDPGHIVLDGDPAPSPKEHSPQFSAHVCCGPLKGHILQFLVHVRCGQTAGWIKMPLGMVVGLGPGDIVLDGDQVPLPKKGAQQPSPIFGPYSVAKRLDGSRCHLVRR